MDIYFEATVGKLKGTVKSKQVWLYSILPFVHTNMVLYHSTCQRQPFAVNSQFILTSFSHSNYNRTHSSFSII